MDKLHCTINSCTGFKYIYCNINSCAISNCIIELTKKMLKQMSNENGD